MPSLQDKIVIVTGAAGGIGHGVAKHFLSEGARVYGVDLAPTTGAVMSDIGAEAGIVADIADADAVTDLVQSLAEHEGRIDVLVNAAGIHRPAPFIELDLTDFEAVMRVNVLGTLIPSQAVARVMVARQTRGSIINLASVAAEHVTPVSTAYATSKGAIVSMTRGAAMSLATHGIRVNAIAPGPVETPMNAARREDPVYLARMIERVPMGRQGTVADIAEAAAFLAGDGSGWITGELLHVDGGISVLR